MARSRQAPTVSASAALKQVLQGIREGWAPGLTVLNGDDAYHLDSAQRALLHALVPSDATDFALSVYGEQKVDIATVINAVKSVGMFAPRRVVLVREVSALDGDPAALVEYAKQPPDSSYLIIRAASLDRRRKLHQALIGAGRLLEFKAPPPEAWASLAADVSKLASDKGLRVDRPAAAMLAELCAGDFYRIDAELEKIRTWLGDTDDLRVTPEIVREIASGSGLMSGWEVADAILTRDLRAALDAVRRLVHGGDEPIRIVGGLAWRARTMLQAKALAAGRMPPQKIVQTVRAWAYRDKLFAGLERYSLAELLTFPGKLLDADRTLKSRSIHPQAVLENLVERLTAPSGRN